MNDRGPGGPAFQKVRVHEPARAVLREALGADAGELELLMRVSRAGCSEGLPTVRLFAYRRSELVACVKQIPKQPPVDRERIAACYTRFADRPSFTVPRLLATSEDADYHYFVEEAVQARNLAVLVAGGTLTIAAASAVLDAVLLELWALTGEVSDDLIRHTAETLLATADTIFGDQPLRGIVDTAFAALRRDHSAELRTALTTHDIIASNVLHADGRTWLVDFDLASETAFFGLDYIRAWALSPGLRAPQPTPPFASATSYRLCRRRSCRRHCARSCDVTRKTSSSAWHSPSTTIAPHFAQ